MKKKIKEDTGIIGISDIMSSIKKMGDDMLIRDGVDKVNEMLHYYTSGVFALDWIISKGRGLPKGKIIEIFGPENSGKTSLVNCIYSQWQNNGRIVMLDFEHRYNAEFAASHGVDCQKMLFIQPRSGEKALELIERKIIGAKDVAVVCVDSIPAIITKQEMAGDYGDANIGAQARLVSQFVRQLSGKLFVDSPLVILTNQLRDAVGDLFKNEKTPGGRALKFFASIRINLRKKEKIKKSGEVVGHYVKITIEKSSIGPAHREIEVPFYYETGFDNSEFLKEKGREVGMFRNGEFHLNEKIYSEKKAKTSRKISYKIWQAILEKLNQPKVTEETGVGE